MRMFKSRVLRKIWVQDGRGKGEWTRLHKLRGLLSVLFKYNLGERRMRWVGHVARIGKSKGVCRVWVGRYDGKRQLGRPRRRWEDNIQIDLQEVKWKCVDWIGLVQDRDRWRKLVSATVNLGVSQIARNLLTS